ncbi:MAG: 50S ribosomal protein L3 [Candidatus Woesearchaeota archaeon]|nr:50S ribosomal protein L3 [Candidatus Woesearchaeota archaeon]
MPTTRSPHKGSMQFWPRKRAQRPYARIRTYAADRKECAILGFAGYKVGMMQAIILDSRAASLTKGEEIVSPVTIIECPPLRLASIRFYKNINGNPKVATEILVGSEKELSRKICLSKKSFEDKMKEIGGKLSDFSDIRALVYTKPSSTGIGKKKPEIFETALSGDVKDKFNYLKERIGKDITVDEVLREGERVDIHAVTKGYGIQGPVKRFGVAIRAHKSEATKRGPGSLSDWCSQGKIMYRVAHAGQMGYHLRTEYNKLIFKVGKDDINVKSGFEHYGKIRNPYVLIKGSVAGSEKRLIRMNCAIREKKKLPEGALQMKNLISDKE